MGPMLKHATNVTRSGVKGIRWNGEGGGTVQNREHIWGVQGYGGPSSVQKVVVVAGTPSWQVQVRRTSGLAWCRSLGHLLLFVFHHDCCYSPGSPMQLTRECISRILALNPQF